MPHQQKGRSHVAHSRVQGPTWSRGGRGGGRNMNMRWLLIIHVCGWMGARCSLPRSGGCVLIKCMHEGVDQSATPPPKQHLHYIHVDGSSCTTCPALLLASAMLTAHTISTHLHLVTPTPSICTLTVKLRGREWGGGWQGGKEGRNAEQPYHNCPTFC